MISLFNNTPCQGSINYFKINVNEVIIKGYHAAKGYKQSQL